LQARSGISGAPEQGYRSDAHLADWAEDVSTNNDAAKKKKKKKILRVEIIT